MSRPTAECQKPTIGLREPQDGDPSLRRAVIFCGLRKIQKTVGQKLTLAQYLVETATRAFCRGLSKRSSGRAFEEAARGSATLCLYAM